MIERAAANGIELDFEDRGDGEPVLLLHGAFVADSFRPLFSEPALAGRYRLIAPRRRGYGGSTGGGAATSIREQAADSRALLSHLGVERAHVVGHSFGGLIALQLALDAPGLVHSLALAEPALAVGESGPAYLEALALGGVRYREIGAEAVLHEFPAARWPDYDNILETVVPGAFEQAVTDAATWFEQELPAQLGWEFDESYWERIPQPALSVLGGTSEELWPRFGETHRTVLERLPMAEGVVLAGATHFLQLESATISRQMAECLSDFFDRHPILPKPS